MSLKNISGCAEVSISSGCCKQSKDLVHCTRKAQAAELREGYVNSQGHLVAGTGMKGRTVRVSRTNTEHCILVSATDEREEVRAVNL